MPYVVIFFSSIYVLLLDYSAPSARSLQKALVLPIIAFLIIVTIASRTSWKAFFNKGTRELCLFWMISLVQSIIIATGGLFSPFFILIHLFMIGLSFLFSFSSGLFFILGTMSIIFIDVLFHDNLVTVFIHNPASIILELASLISIIPIAYVIVQKYQVKDLLSRFLQQKITTAEAIMGKLPELIIVTDANLRILSVNDTVEQTLGQSKSELITMPVFDVLFLQDTDKKLLTRNRFFSNKSLFSTPHTVTLVNAHLSQKQMTLSMHRIKNPETDTYQISFILTSEHKQETSRDTIFPLVDKARTKYEALCEDIKTQLSQKKLSTLHTHMLLLETMEDDIYELQCLSLTRKTKPSRVDIAKLCKQVVSVEQDLAHALKVHLTFQLQNFGQADIAPLTVRHFPVQPEDLTGPFFTVAYDVKALELMVRKLLIISMFLASSEATPTIRFSLIRKGASIIQLYVEGDCPAIEKAEILSLFIPYYQELSSKTNLHLGSGLEGFLLKEITEVLRCPLLPAILVKNGQNRITFTIELVRFRTYTE